MAKKILIAEDEEHIAKLVEFKLKHEGFEVIVAPDGQQAIDRLEAEPWSMIILDVMMPHKDGWEVLKAIRANEKLNGLPVLMLTAKGNQKDQAAAAELGATHYLKKPFDPNELSNVVKKLTGEGI